MSEEDQAPAVRTRTHNSPRPVIALAAVRQAPHSRKPSGLWYSFGNGWHDYVSSASRAQARARGLGSKKAGPYDYEVVPGDGCRLLRLANWEAILAFTVEYGQNVAHAQNGFWWQKEGTGRYDPAQDPDMPRGCRVACIDWPRVAERFDGIEVPNYDSLRSVRPRVEWLDIDWALSSGCIWNPRDVELLPMDLAPSIAIEEEEPTGCREPAPSMRP